MKWLIHLISDQKKLRLNEINKIKDYFYAKIQERKTMSKKMSKYIAAFDYNYKILIILSATSGGVCIISSASVIGAPVEMPGASFTLVFSLTTGIIKKLLKIIRNKKKKHNTIAMLAESKWNSIENLVSQALIDLEISYEEFKTIANGKKSTKEWKEILEWWRVVINWVKISIKKKEMYRTKKNNIFFNIYKMFLILIETWKNVVLEQLFLAILRKIKKN